MSLTLSEVPSPIGMLYVVEGESGVCALGFEDERDTALAGTGKAVRDDTARGRDVRRRERGACRPISTAISTRSTAYASNMHGTPFQQRVWAALRKVRRGRTATYGQIAQVLGQPTATRAVGMANARNPVAIVVPCHRIVGANGTLTGYAGGLDRKRWLLRHEGIPV